MTASIVAAACAALVTVVCLMLVLHKDYEDGLFGRIGLALIALASSARTLQLAEGGFSHQPNPIAMVLWAGLALFLARHLYRFLRWRRNGEGDWRGTDRAATCGKR